VDSHSFIQGVQSKSTLLSVG